MPGPSSSTASTTSPLRRSTRGLDRGARVGVAQRVLHQVEHEPVQLVARALDLRARRRGDRDLVVAGHRLELGGRLGDDLGEVDRAVRRLAARRRRGRAAAGRRPAGASGATSAARTRPPRAARPRAPPRAARGWPAPRSAACAARARRRRRTRAGGPARPRSPCAPSSSASSIASSVRGELGDLVVGLRAGDAQRRVARALDLARGVRQLGDRLHRAARGGQAGQQGERGAAEHAEGEEQLHAVDRGLDVRDAGARTGCTAVAGRRRRERARSRPASRRPRSCCGARAGRSPARRRLRRSASPSGDDADRRVLGRRVVVEVGRSRVAPQRRPAVVDAVAGASPPARACRPPAATSRLKSVADRRVVSTPTIAGEAAAGSRASAPRGAAGEPPADRQAPIRGGRSPRRGPYGGVEARHRLRASFAGWTRTPRSCS